MSAVSNQFNASLIAGSEESEESTERTVSTRQTRSRSVISAVRVLARCSGDASRIWRAMWNTALPVVSCTPLGPAASTSATSIRSNRTMSATSCSRTTLFASDRSRFELSTLTLDSNWRMQPLPFRSGAQSARPKLAARGLCLGLPNSPDQNRAASARFPDWLYKFLGK